MTKNESYLHDSTLQAIALMGALLLLLRPVMHASDGGLTSLDWVIIVGAVLGTMVLSVLGVLGTRRRRVRPA